jgi:hypothetical protein
MDSPRIFHGQPMDSPWIAHGQPMDSPWTQAGKECAMGYTGIICKDFNFRKKTQDSTRK